LPVREKEVGIVFVGFVFGAFMMLVDMCLFAVLFKYLF
jgi:hypothetical protein